MRDDFGIEGVVPVKVALTAEQIDEFHLPPQMTAKATSSNYNKFSKRHGDAAYELEALNPSDLQAVLRDAIESVIDREALNHELAMEKQDAAHLQALRWRVQSMLATVVGGGANGR
jgi:hypothetical protein